MQPARTYADFSSYFGGGGRLRATARDAAVLALSIGRNIHRTSGWIRFPYYHHVFDDERHGFGHQLDYPRGFGEFISLDDVVGLRDSGETIAGCYFCITFDDGLKNCLTNGVPILLGKSAPAAFFMTTGYIDNDPEKNREKLLGFFDHGKALMEFLSWQDCHDMARRRYDHRLAHSQSCPSHQIKRRRCATRARDVKGDD
jgi:peptidoglycan/xylan/chitin deacetylase (PgdA/CDA1 family)